MLSLIGALALGGLTPPPDLDVLKSGVTSRLRLSGGPVFHTTKNPVLGARALDLPGNTAVVLWKEKVKGGTQPYYAVSLNGRTINTVQEASYELLLRYAEFDPAVNAASVEGGLKADETNQVYIVQFHSQTLDEYREALTRAGATIDYYLANHSYIVHMDAQTKSEVQAMDFVRWVGPYEPAYRIEPEVRQMLSANRLRPMRYNIQVYQYGPTQKASLVNMINGIGGRVDAAIPDGYMVVAYLTPDQLRQVAKFNEVFFIDRWGPMEEDMNIARDLSGANYIEGIAGYTGQGVRGQVRDGGVRQTHSGFQASPLSVRSNTTNTGHGTNTTGIVFGTGANNANGRGMLPNGQGIFIAGLPLGANRYNETQALLAAPYFAVFESNSTGSPLTTAYGTESFTMDDILWRLNILICQSQSNAGTQQSRPQAWAKNIISVGGVKHMNTLATTDDNWTGGGSIGPAADGRIKPDLAHFYDNITCASSTSDTSYTTTFGGTSGATPITCGHFGLFFQMWADGVFGQTVTGATVFDARPMNSTARAVMINTATQWAFSGTTHDLTRTHQGWGRADVRSMYDLRNKLFVVDEGVNLTNLQSKSYVLSVTPGQPELKVTMVYNDPPGTTSSTQHRINDLSLKVTSPNGTVYWGNNGLLAAMYSTSGGVANDKDTVENVFVQNPQFGNWTVEVIASQINADAVLETPAVDADFALVASGVHAASAPASFAVIDGTLNSGNLANLATSNNQRVEIGSPILRNNAWTVAMRATGVAPNSKPKALRTRIETSGTASEVTYELFLEEEVGARRTLVGSGTITPNDSVVEVSVPDPARFVYQGSNEVRLTVVFKTPEGSPNNSWNVKIDQIRWLFTTP